MVGIKGTTISSTFRGLLKGQAPAARSSRSPRRQHGGATSEYGGGDFTGPAGRGGTRRRTWQ